MNRNSAARKARLISIAVAAVMGISACAGSTPTPAGSSAASGSSTASGSATASGSPASGGTLVVAQKDVLDCLDPVQRLVGAHPFEDTVSTLTAQNSETGEVQPWLATEWEPNDDATSFTFTLREGVTFSDGQPLDAESVKLTFDSLQRLVDEGVSSNAAPLMPGYAGTEVIDDTHVRINFDAPLPSFPAALATMVLGIVSPTTSALSAEERCVEGFIAAGPYVFGEVRSGESVTITAREDFDWPNPFAEHEGRGYLDSISFRFVPEPSVRVGGLGTGEFDVIDGLDGDTLAQVEAEGGITDGVATAGAPLTIAPNLDHPVMSDLAVRQAVNLAIDRQGNAEAFYTAFDEPAKSVLTSNVPGFTDLSEHYAYDPERAAEILEEAGWVEGDDGIREKDGQRLTFQATWIYEGYDQMFQAMQQQLAEVGIEMTLNFTVLAEFRERKSTRDFGGLLIYELRADPDVLHQLYNPTVFDLYTPEQMTDVVELLNEQSSTAAPDERADVTAQIQTLMAEEALSIPIMSRSIVIGYRSDVQGVNPRSTGWVSFYDARKTADAN
jgi:peptide/nickel transport system substrate-binding protein